MITLSFSGDTFMLIQSHRLVVIWVSIIQVITIKGEGMLGTRGEYMDEQTTDGR